MKRLDPTLLRRLEQQDNANELLAIALGVCPTCGQAMPSGKPGGVNRSAKPAQRVRREPAPNGTRKAAVIEYLTKTDTAFGNQTRCAEALGCNVTYVNKLWNDYQRGRGRLRKRPTGKREAIIAWLQAHPDSTQTECAEVHGVTRAYVNAIDPRRDEETVSNGEASNGGPE